MSSRLDWDQPEEIALRLLERFPDRDPLAVRFTELRRWVLELEGFSGDPAASSEGRLEAIQMAWWEAYKERGSAESR